MTNFIRTDQEHRRCAGRNQLRLTIREICSIEFVLESPDEPISACTNNSKCLKNLDFLKVISFGFNGKSFNILIV
jgi:hypothetical protein